MSCREIGERFLDFSWQPESRKKLLEHKEAIEFKNHILAKAIMITGLIFILITNPSSLNRQRGT